MQNDTIENNLYARAYKSKWALFTGSFFIGLYCGFTFVVLLVIC